VRPGEVYALRLGGEGRLRATFDWEDVTRVSLTTQSFAFDLAGSATATFAAPPGAAGLRLRLEPLDGTATARDPQLTLAAGVRVEPFPDGRRAALAFSFDWESAMGGLIHTRSDDTGEAGGVSLGNDGSPSVADAEEKGQRMRDGAQFLADLFGRYGIKATFYATGYDLLDGNPTCQKFNGDPIYRNADTAHGWGSDWWRTHPWYGNDPCTTEVQSPAWYFASETRALAAEGHEISSHTFGHLYVRGVTPEQLAADLELWQRTATALGLPTARSFAFPWTSSNSLDAPFWAVFERVGMTILTRLYQTKEQPLRHPYELDRIAGDPNLLAFPDFYLASNTEAENEALARIDVTVAVRGYHSLWDHPNESLEQSGQAVWTRVVDYAAAQRDQGLWIAPVTEIATYSTATRAVDLVALPLAGGTQLMVTNGTGRGLDGLTITLAGPSAANVTGVRALGTDQVAFSTLAAGAQVTATVRR
jgi:peptidoglycan/xylan/chitin deacetylase (PgdA/CDA1 family)